MYLYCPENHFAKENYFENYNVCYIVESIVILTDDWLTWTWWGNKQNNMPKNSIKTFSKTQLNTDIDGAAKS